jgi:hypothetical protein
MQFGWLVKIAQKHVHVLDSLSRRGARNFAERNQRRNKVVRHGGGPCLKNSRSGTRALAFASKLGKPDIHHCERQARP